jgi:hypothetical protein
MNTTTNRYGKSIGDIVSLKKHFFENNDKFLYREKEIAEIYCKMPKREQCKICGTVVGEEVLFNNRGTNYYLCNTCGHLNGEFDDGYAYSEALYRGGIYGKESEYRSPTHEQYVRRVGAIYTPKAWFLLDNLASVDPDYKTYQYLDIGAGAGQMVYALRECGVNVHGLEVDKVQVEYANKILKQDLLQEMDIENVTNTIRKTNSEVITFINVLEHVTNLQEILATVTSNEHIKYIYFCVPLLSLTCAFEVILPDVFARHIGSGGRHTHLFTNDSLAYIYIYYGFTPIASWHFGTDIMDLYRSIVVMLKKKNANDKFISTISRIFDEHTDAIQQIIDKAGFASDIHVLARVH